MIALIAILAIIDMKVLIALIYLIARINMIALIGLEALIDTKYMIVILAMIDLIALMNPLLCTACKPAARRWAVTVVGSQCTSTHTHCKPTIGRRALYHTLSI